MILITINSMSLAEANRTLMFVWFMRLVSLALWVFMG